MRITPAGKYSGLPCSYVGSGCAYEDIFGEVFDKPLPEGLKSDGWLTLEGNNRYVRSLFDVAKKVYYKRGERPMLRDFLSEYKGKALVCVYGHFVYCTGGNYYSFFKNDYDEIVCIWYLKEHQTKK
jgi:hypothetical protein